MGFSFWQVLIVLVIVLLLFGTKKLRNVGGDLGGAIKGFKQAMKEGEDDNKPDDKPAQLEKNEQASSANTETTEQKDQHKS